jgi:uncharacterized protein
MEPRMKFFRVNAIFIAAIVMIMPPVIAQDGAGEAPAAVQALDPVPVPQGATQDVDPALWVVKDDDTTIYLFGTVHILKPGLGWFDGSVKAAFDSSDRLVLEIVEPAAAEAQALFTAFAMNRNGNTLRSRLNDAQRTRYERAMTRIGVAAETFDPFDPWAAAVTMQVMGMTKSGFDLNNGVEKQLVAAAKVSDKPVEGVETMAYQLGIFDSLSDEQQVAFLDETAKNIDDLGSTMDRLVALWAAPDPDGLAAAMNEGLTDPRLYNALLTKRNASWAKWINQQMEKPGVTFMAVGAGHLAGSTSVQALLLAYGVNTQRVAY